MVHLLPMNFTPQASALLTRLWACTPFTLQSHQTARTHYSYNPLYEGYHTLLQPGDCTSFIMTTHKLVFLGDLDVKDASFIRLLGFAKQNPSEKETTIDDEPCKIRVYEIAGLDEATDGLIYGAEGIIYFYNAALRSSFERIPAIHDKLQKTSPPSIQVVIVGIVLVGTVPEVSFKEGNELARKLGCKFSLETEATVGDWLGRTIRQAREAQGDTGVSWWSCFGWR